MIDPGDIMAARQALGRLLAEYRKAAGLRQHQLAPLTHYGRSTIANVETGRQNVPRDFWERCDRAVNAGGRLLAASERLDALVRQQREETARLAEAEQAAGVAGVAAHEDSGSVLGGLLGRSLAVLDQAGLAAPELHDVATVTAGAEQPGQPGEGVAVEGDVTDRRNALTLGLLSAAAPEVVARVLEGAAGEAMEFTRRSGITDVGRGTFDQLETVVTGLDRAYSQSPAGEQLVTARAYRAYVQQLIDGRHTLKEARELYAYAGWLSEMLAWQAHDLGNPLVAEAYAIDCYEHADQAGHDELCAWACDAMASIAMYAQQPERAVKATYRGIAKAPLTHPLAVRLRAQAARAYAKLGRRDECEQLFAEAHELYDRLPSSPPRRFAVDTGTLADYALTAYPASSYLWLGDYPTARRHALDALTIHEQAPPGARSPSREAIARLDLAIALVALGSPDEAAAHGRQALASPRVVDSVRTRAGDLDAALTGRYPDLPDTRAFHDQYRELLAGAP